MLRSLKELHDYAVSAVDGVVGRVMDLYLDDEAWVVRYLVVDTGGWLLSRKVLISPIAVGDPDWENRLLPVSVTQEQAQNSPEFDAELPLTRRHELVYAGHYGYPHCWGGAGYWGGGLYPNTMLSSDIRVETLQAVWQPADNTRPAAGLDREPSEDPHLRSCAEITGYPLRASDGDIGHVCGMLIFDKTWAVRYLIVDTSNWWVGHQMLVAPKWIEGLRWAEGTVSVNLTRQTIKDAPTYTPGEKRSRANESRLYEHCGRAGYWADDEKRETEISRV